MLFGTSPSQENYRIPYTRHEADLVCSACKPRGLIARKASKAKPGSLGLELGIIAAKQAVQRMVGAASGRNGSVERSFAIAIGVGICGKENHK